ncbi:MAG: hypothetical protein WBA79_12515 [Mycobacterium sp.]
MFSMLPVTVSDMCTLSRSAVVTLDSFRMAAASGRGSVDFLGDVGAVDDEDAVDDGGGDSGAGNGEAVGAVLDKATVVDEGAGGEGADEQPATRAAALTTDKTAGSLRMPAIVEGRPINRGRSRCDNEK